MKKTHDYDSTFKTLKNRHTRLFIAVINMSFNKNYPLDSEIKILSSEGAFVDVTKPDDESKVRIKDNDFLKDGNASVKVYKEGVYAGECWLSLKSTIEQDNDADWDVEVIFRLTR